MPVLRRRRGRRPKIDKLLEASALESMIAANSGAASLAGTLTSAGLTGGLNMLWPMAGFEECLSLLADANMAERSRLLLADSKLGLPVAHDDVQQTSSTFTGGDHEEQLPKSVAGETSVGSLDLRALLNKEGGRLQQTTSWPPADGESGEPSATSAEACQDSQPKDVHASLASDADLPKDSRSRDADTYGMNLTSGDSDRTPRRTGEHHRSAGHDNTDEPTDQPLKLTSGKDLSISETPSRDASRQSAGEDDEDVTSRLRGSDDVVARWLAEHRNTFDRQGLEDEVQSEVIWHDCYFMLEIIALFIQVNNMVCNVRVIHIYSIVKGCTISNCIATQRINSAFHPLGVNK